ncbi:MAG: hypothetical protein UH080_05635 [Ruminococcus sp.]|nr:hypothetical protein [Ruminococcus sp.]
MNKDVAYNRFMRKLYTLLENGAITKSELDKRRQEYCDKHKY